MYDYGLYYGLPQSIWSGLCEQTEETFYEEELGQVILGIYPSGPRMLGIEAEAPSILCLYLDSEEDILNPLTKPKELSFSVGYSGSYIRFQNIWDWVCSFSGHIPISSLIPCFHDSIYQEELIEEILYAARQHLLATYPYKKLISEHILESRASLIFKKTGKFSPNINPEWDRVVLLEEILDADCDSLAQYDTLLALDKQLREDILDNKYSSNRSSLQHNYINAICQFIKSSNRAKEYPSRPTEIDNTLDTLGKTTSKFYRSII